MASAHWGIYRWYSDHYLPRLSCNLSLGQQSVAAEPSALQCANAVTSAWDNDGREPGIEQSG